MIADWFEALRRFGLALPEAVEEFPWGHSALKVNGKTFVFLDQQDGLSLSVKLPVSRDFALTAFDFAEPTGYGLGRSGWVTARFAEADEPDLELLQRWIVESYRAIAPKKLAKEVREPE